MQFCGECFCLFGNSNSHFPHLVLRSDCARFGAPLAALELTPLSLLPLPRLDMSTTDTSLEAHTELRAPVAQLSPSRVVQLGPQAAHSPTRLGGKTPPSATAMELDGSSEEAQGTH